MVQSKLSQIIEQITDCHLYLSRPSRPDRTDHRVPPPVWPRPFKARQPSWSLPGKMIPHAAGWKRSNQRHLLLCDMFRGVGSVLYRSRTPHHNARSGSRWSSSRSVQYRSLRVWILLVRTRLKFPLEVRRVCISDANFSTQKPLPGKMVFLGLVQTTWTQYGLFFRKWCRMPYTLLCPEIQEPFDTDIRVQNVTIFSARVLLWI